MYVACQSRDLRPRSKRVVVRWSGCDAGFSWLVFFVAVAACVYGWEVRDGSGALDAPNSLPTLSSEPSRLRRHRFVGWSALALTGLAPLVAPHHLRIREGCPYVTSSAERRHSKGGGCADRPC